MSIAQAILYGIELAFAASTAVVAIVYVREARRIRANRKRALPWSPISKLPDRKS